MQDGKKSPNIVRIAIVGSNRKRVAKVISILRQNNELSTLIWSNDKDKDLSKPNENIIEKEHKHYYASEGNDYRIDYLACVASFESYMNENDENVRYLSKLEYHGTDGNITKGASLAPFFDEEDPTSKKESKQKITGGGGGKNVIINLPGVAAVVIGCGIELKEDMNMIQSFFHTLSGGIDISTLEYPKSDDIGDISDIDISLKLSSKHPIILMTRVTPNPEFKSMREENEYYKNLNDQQKDVVTRLGTIGPGKMTNLISFLSHATLQHYFPKFKKYTENVAREQPTCANIEEIESAPLKQEMRNNVKEESNAIELPQVDTTNTRYACRICRTILFGKDNLEDPPHTKAKHQFSIHKCNKSGIRSNSVVCQSIFLSSVPYWVQDSSALEGKIHCIQCNNKLGQWKWAGTQCSCGTWVTPAIQIPLSRVDVIHPVSNGGMEHLRVLNTFSHGTELPDHKNVQNTIPNENSDVLADLFVSQLYS